MHLVLVVRRSGRTRARGYIRAVDRPYSRAPMVGEDVMLDDAGEHGMPVERVSWDNDGAAVLRFSEPPVSHAWLLAAGFDVVYDTGAAAS